MSRDIIEKSEDVVKSLFTGKYSWEEVLDTLAALEHFPIQMFEMFKQHQPKYIFASRLLSSFTLLQDLKKFYGKS